MIEYHTSQEKGVPGTDVAEIVAVRSPSGEIVVLSVTETLAAWMGRSVDELKGVRLSEMAGEAVPGLGPAVEEVLAGGRPAPLSMTFTSPGGTHHQVGIVVRRPEAFTAAGMENVVVIRFDRGDRFRSQADLTAFTSFHGLIGHSHAMLAVFRRIASFGPTDASVIITGETGTGKELAARALHKESRRSTGPFEAVNCTAISEDLLESELFGHERGSFTGAVRTHRGRFERADKGTLFLDEIGDMPMMTQAKLLRVLQEGMVERVGAERSVRVDVRVVAATNHPLETLVSEGRFRADLYHRLSVLRLHLPALREREGDLEFLIEHFLGEFARKYGRGTTRLTPGAMALLRNYTWPGNIRELRNVMERVFIENQGDVIGRRAFDEWILERQALSPGQWNLAALKARLAGQPPIIVPTSRPLLPGPETPAGSVAENEPIEVSGPAHMELTREVMLKAFREAGGNITVAARSLGIHKATFYRKMKSLGLKREDFDSNIMSR